MYTIIIALLTVMVTAAVYWLFITTRKNSPLKWYLWAAIGLWFIWTILGTSFVVQNAIGLHYKASVTGAFFCYIVSVITGFPLARLIGLWKPFKMNKNENSVEA